MSRKENKHNNQKERNHQAKTVVLPREASGTGPREEQSKHQNLDKKR